ncbi:MAG: methyltransferase domain-containing protein [Nitrospirae bacterium]|nr:methyltransferase domain-containing protein [Nitrospirota bacterium]
MKDGCLKYMVCPICKSGNLIIQVQREDKGEVMEGDIKCSCGASYPIIAGVPRMLVGDLLKNVLKEYSNKGTQKLRQANEDSHIVRRNTIDAFGYEWRFYSDYDANNYFNWMPEGIVPEKIFQNKVGLEIGCGAGRHAAKTAQWAGVHFAVDISYAVDSAFQQTRYLPNCHVIQADAFNLPFKERGFDYVYCLGVIQHMHHPPEGFSHLARQPRQGGALLVNVYQSSRPFTTGLLEAVRKITTKMPLSLLNKLCIVAGTIDYAAILIWRALKLIGLGKVFEPLVPERIREYSRHSYRIVVADWFDRLACPRKIHYSKEDLTSWYQKAGYVDIRVTPYWKAFWNGYGIRG